MSAILCQAQQYIISTVAGGVPPPASATALTSSIGEVVAVAVDNSGNVFFTAADCVFKLDQNGVLTRVAGTARGGYSGDGGTATNAQLYPRSVAVDPSGNLFVADEGNNRVRRISTTGIITTVAGNGVQGFSGDGGPAVNAQLFGPTGIAVDTSGDIFIADQGNIRVRKVSPNGIITTVAGDGSQGFSGDGGPAASAELNLPTAVAVDASGNVFVADTQNGRIRKVSVGGIITTVAGDGTNGNTADGILATNAGMSPSGIAVDGSGNLYIASGSVRKVSTNGIISTVAGSGNPGFSGDGGPASGARLDNPYGVAVDASGNIYIADLGNNRIRKVSAGGIITTIAGNGTVSFSGDGGSAATAQLNNPTSVAVDSSGNLFIADTGNYRVRKVSAIGTITTVAGNGAYGTSGVGGPATSAQMSGPSAVVVDSSGNLFIADSDGAIARIMKVTPNGTINTVAGVALSGFSGDGGPATSAALNNPTGMTVDSAGNLFIADLGNFRVRKVSASSGIITTVAGTGVSGFSGDGGLATSAGLSGPTGVAVDGAGNLYIVDNGLGAELVFGNHRVRKVSANGIITTVAGNGGCCLVANGSPATGPTIYDPFAITVDSSGDLFITEPGDVREVTPGGVINLVAGSSIGYFGDGGPAATAAFSYPQGVVVDGSWDIYIADTSNNAIRKLTPTNQTVLIAAAVDAASESAVPVSPGKIVVIYGTGLGPAQGVTASPSNGLFGTQLAGTTVTVNGVSAPVYYTSAAQVNAIVPYETSGPAAGISVAYQGSVSQTFSVPLSASSPGIFTYNGTGAGQAAAVNAADGTINTAANPVKIGEYISVYATGEGQTTPAGVDGKLATQQLPSPNLPVTVTVGGLPAFVQYEGAAPGAVAGLMQINVQIPNGVTSGGYVPVVLTVGDASTVNGAVWIAVSAP